MNAPAYTWPGLLGALMRGQPLEAAATSWAMDEIMAGAATPAQVAAFVVLLRAKGETTDELTGLVEAMRTRATAVPLQRRAVDIVGTGGDLAHTVNITTMAALVVAGSGRPVVKHGNRSASSQCGSADVLEELGVVIDLDAAGVAETLAEAGIGFCFAPVFHPGFRHAGPPRREIGVPTAFNVLGPLTNPARPPASAVGCADRRMAPLMAEVFARRGDTAMVFRGDDGLDELTTTTTSSLWLAAGGEVRETVVDPGRLGIATAKPDDLRGGDRAYNAGVVHEVLAGRGGPARDAVLLNAAAAIAVYDGIDGSSTVDSQLAAGIDDARRAVDTGAAAELLEGWAAASRRARAEG
ncbi:MAG TPA: anthranilate phosphoribosyltransferase [Jatrophihabitantaceae bacterium]